MKYVALIQKRNEYGNRHFSVSVENETKESFIERLKNIYINPYETPYWELEIFELGEQVY